MTPTLSSSAGANTLEQNAYNTGTALQNTYNQEAGTTYNEEQSQLAQANSAYNNLLNYTQNLPNFGSLYGQYETAQEQQAGYNPAQMQNYVNAANTTAEAYANAPQAAQQMSNYSGATSGQETQNLSNLSGNLATSSAGANTALQNYLALYTAANTAANNQTTQALGGYSLGSANYNDLLTGANTTLQNAVSAANNYSQLQQAELPTMEGAITGYNTSYTGGVASLAAAQASQAAAAASQTQASENAEAAIKAFLITNPTTTAQNMANALGLPLDQVGAFLTDMANNGTLTATANPLGSLNLGSVVNPQSGSVNLQ